MPKLAYPVVMSDSSCLEADPVAGGGFVLIHLWTIVAHTSSQFLCRSLDAAPSMARALAARWARGAKPVVSYEHLRGALRIDEWRIHDLYDRALALAKRRAEEGRLRCPSPLRPGAVTRSRAVGRPA